MTALPVTFCGAQLRALASGALHWPAENMLIFSDLHLGKAERTARRGGPILPPYEVTETLDRLLNDIATTTPKTIICLGDSFDDLAAAHATQEAVADRLAPVMAGRRWIWIEGNHDPGPVNLPGEHRADFAHIPLMFRHIAQESAAGEISGHYHPKASVTLKGRSITRRCFLVDNTRLIMPAYGTYTGGLSCKDKALSGLMASGAVAILLGPTPIALPMPR